MELLSGQSLRSFLRKHRTEKRHVNVRLAVALVAQVLAALEYAHHTVVHRDIKPENVMLLPGEKVKVLDFGLAKAIDEEIVETGEPGHESGRVVGTFAYAAPEQKLRRGVDARSDIYSVGLLFHELLSLRSPLDEPVEVVNVREDVSPSLLTALGKALREDKDARWQTAGEFRHELLHAFEESYRSVGVPHILPGAAETCTDGMVFLEGGSFLMGSSEAPEETPEFEASVEPLYMDIHPVTNEQYARFIEATGYQEPRFWRHNEFNGPLQPVVGVSWADANVYAAWVGKQLPTETQWEFAARGKENRTYPWGNQEPDPTLCNFGDHMNMPSIVTMHEDGKTPEGIHDLAGNVHEWTLDHFLPYDPAHHQTHTTRAASPRRVARGGSWHSGVDELRCSYRKGLFPEAQLTTTGFRCVLPATALHKS
jgi:formylglycine-generating enzyme required for sulfatase activity